jgi:hypothetical protein
MQYSKLNRATTPCAPMLASRNSCAESACRSKSDAPLVRNQKVRFPLEYLLRTTVNVAAGTAGVAAYPCRIRVLAGLRAPSNSNYGSSNTPLKGIQVRGNNHCLAAGSRNERSVISFGSVETGPSRQSQRIISGIIARRISARAYLSPTSSSRRNPSE